MKKIYVAELDMYVEIEEPQQEIEVTNEDKEYTTNEGKPIKLPINSSQSNMQDKKIDYLNLGILTYFSNFQDLHEVEEYDGYDAHRYIYENKIIANKEAIEQYSKTKITTFIRNARKLSKLADENIITVDKVKGENVYRINKGSKFVQIERKILEVLIDCCSSNMIKTYVFLKWRVGTKGDIVSRKEIASNIGMSTSGQRQLQEIKNITLVLYHLGLIERQIFTPTSTNGKQYNSAIFYRIVPYEEWLVYWNSTHKK